MAETHVISVLTKGGLNFLEKSNTTKNYSNKAKITHIDNTIKIFDENYNLTSIRPKRVHRERYFKTGESKILILDILRTATKLLSTNEIGGIPPLFWSFNILYMIIIS